MSANKHKSVGGRKKPLTESEKCESYVLRLSMDVSKACDDYQMRTNGYKSNGFRGIINTAVLKTQAEKA
tara:strand:- start:727 stop:933 length:207 start_codon:yes stop_codon:yes gene_type:complete